MGTFNLSCLQYRPIKRMLFTEWTHPNKIAYNMEKKSEVRLLQFIMDRSNLHFLVYGITKRILSRTNTHQIYVQIKPTLLTLWSH